MENMLHSEINRSSHDRPSTFYCSHKTIYKQQGEPLFITKRSPRIRQQQNRKSKMPHHLIPSTYMEIARDEYQRCMEMRRSGGAVTLNSQPRVLQLFADAASPGIFRRVNDAVVAHRNTTNKKRARIESNNTSASRPPSNAEPVQKRKKSVPFDNGTFPFRLHEILDTCELRQLISWQTHGRAWKVHSPEEFAKHLPKYFPKQTKYASFIRQVNMWSFARICTGPDEGCYYHQSFSKRNPMLCREMVRKRSVPRKKFQPDFYKDSQQSDRR